MADTATELQQLSRALSQLADDAELRATLHQAARARDLDGYRDALRRLPLPDAPGACRLICELVGHYEEGGEWDEVCELPHPKVVKPSGLISDEELEAIAALPKSERYAAVYDLYREKGLLECRPVYKPGKLQPYYWCELVCAPELPWGPIAQAG